MQILDFLDLFYLVNFTSVSSSPISSPSSSSGTTALLVFTWVYKFYKIKNIIKKRLSLKSGIEKGGNGGNLNCGIISKVFENSALFNTFCGP